MAEPYEKHFHKKILSRLHEDPALFLQATKRLQKDEAYLLQAIKINPKVTEYILTKFRNDPEFMLKAIKINPEVISYVSDALRGDPNFMEKAAWFHPSIISFANPKLRDDKYFCRNILHIFSLRGNKYLDLAHLPKDPCDDEATVTAAGPFWFALASDRLQSDKVFVLSFMQRAQYQVGEIVKHLHAHLKNDEEIILAANGYGLQFISEEKRRDKQLVLKLLHQPMSNKTEIFKFLPPSLKDDAEVVLAANDDEFAWASERLKKDKTFVLQLIHQPMSNKAKILRLLDVDLKADEEVILAIVGKDSSCLSMIDKKWLSNREFMQKVAALSLSKAQSTSAQINPRAIAREFDRFLQTTYVKPNEEQQEIWDQIKYAPQNIGRHSLPLLTTAPVSTKTTPSITADSFLSPSDKLTETLREHFKDEPLFFEYSIFEPKSAPKGVIISHYGGYAEHDFNASSRALLSAGEQALVDLGYTLIRFITHDNWQTTSQWEQVNCFNPLGNDLLNVTLIQLLLFSIAVKARYDDLPLIFSGASFGGFKGALVNLLLSNKENLITNKEAEHVFKRLLPILSRTNPSLFAAYVLHDGGYDHLKNFSHLLTRPIQNPTLVLHNYDDECVPFLSPLVFIDQQMKAGVQDGVIILHMTPQGGGGPVQKRNPDGNHSYDAHYLPQPVKYSIDYHQKMVNFISQLKPITPELETEQASILPNRPSVLSIRHKHGSHLYGTGNKNQLYRLYHALLHLGSSADNDMISRLRCCFSLMSDKSPRDDKQAVYQQLVIQYGAWLIATLLQKRQETFSLLKTKKSPQSQPQDATTSRFFKERSHDTIAARLPHFCLSHDAQQYLHQNKEDTSVLMLCCFYAKHITKNTLLYFKKNLKKIGSCIEFGKLWGIDPSWINIVDFSTASRVMSIIQLYYTNPSEQIELLHCVQDQLPEFVIELLGRYEFSVDEMKHFMTKLMEQPEENRKQFIHQTAGLLCKDIRFMKKTMIDFLSQIQIESRDVVVRHYLIAGRFLDWNEEQLSIIRDNPALILKDGFATTMASLRSLREELSSESLKIRP